MGLRLAILVTVVTFEPSTKAFQGVPTVTTMGPLARKPYAYALKPYTLPHLNGYTKYALCILLLLILTIPLPRLPPYPPTCTHVTCIASKVLSSLQTPMINMHNPCRGQYTRLWASAASAGPPWPSLRVRLACPWGSACTKPCARPGQKYIAVDLQWHEFTAAAA